MCFWQTEIPGDLSCQEEYSTEVLGAEATLREKHTEQDMGFVGRKAEDRHDNTLQVCSSGRKIGKQRESFSCFLTWPQLTPYLSAGLESQGWIWRCRVILSVPYSYANKGKIAKICITNPCLMGAKVPPPLGCKCQHQPTLTAEGKAVWEFS